jgi:hypothetical protein
LKFSAKFTDISKEEKMSDTKVPAIRNGSAPATAFTPRYWHHGTSFEAVKAMLFYSGGKLTCGWLTSDPNYADRFVIDINLTFDFSNRPEVMSEYLSLHTDPYWPVAVKKPVPLTYLSRSTKDMILLRLEKTLMGPQKEARLEQASKMLFA